MNTAAHNEFAQLKVQYLLAGAAEKGATLDAIANHLIARNGGNTEIRLHLTDGPTIDLSTERDPQLLFMAEACLCNRGR